MSVKTGNAAQLEQVGVDEGDVQEDGRQPLAVWNVTLHDFPMDACVPQLVARQAAMSPDAIALISGKQTLSYKELNSQANQLAHFYRR
jgi:non-ribosomal peptide synthetase component F